MVGFGKPSHEIIRIKELQQLGVDVGFETQRAFKNSLIDLDVRKLEESTWEIWGDKVTTLDLFSGGGSIPLESSRMGFTSLANELNPVACTVLEASCVYPIKSGNTIAQSARKWGDRWIRQVEARMGRFFPANPKGEPRNYIYARTILCPDTQYPTPLVGDWELQRNGKNAVYATVTPDSLNGDWNLAIKETGRASSGTYRKGDGISIFTNNPISGDYIKTHAQQGNMGSRMYAVAIKRPKMGLTFSVPTEKDIAALSAAEIELSQLVEEWDRDGILPNEEIGISNYDRGHRLYGIRSWREMFTPRQLLLLGVMSEELRRIRSEIINAEGKEVGEIVEQLLAFVIDKFANYNTTLASWHVSAQTMRSAFDKHNYEFKSTFAEMAPFGPNGGFTWAIDNVISAYEDLSALPHHPYAQPVTIFQGSATNLLSIDDKSITAVVTDPPYDDNVQYSELSDFFYVWLKRTQGHRRPEWFSTYLTDRTEEAIVNKKFHEQPGMKPKEAEVPLSDLREKISPCVLQPA